MYKQASIIGIAQCKVLLFCLKERETHSRLSLTLGLCKAVKEV